MAGCMRYCVVRRGARRPQASRRSKREMLSPPAAAVADLTVGGSCDDTKGMGALENDDFALSLCA